MEMLRKNLEIMAKNWLKIGIMTVLISVWSLSLATAVWSVDLTSSMLLGFLAQGNAITDPNAILRYALPIENPTVRKIQASLEDIAYHLRSKRWSAIAKDIKDANYELNLRSAKILVSIPADRHNRAEVLLASIKDQVGQLQEAVAAKDKEQVANLRDVALEQIGDLEMLMVQGFPYEVPADYANLPQLKGRATVAMETTQGPLTIVVDGYSAPVSGGNFIDLVQRGFYDGLPFIQTEDNFVVQTGDPDGPEVGFIDPETKAYRAIPLEVLVKSEPLPIYEMTLEDAGLYLPELALPFNAFGAVALARPDQDPNGGSSQFFFFKFDSELTPPGFNLMDGRYSVFGYVVKGKETLEKLSEKDKVIAAKVIAGSENLVQPQA
jgi:peptidylprolyl isomerase